MTELFSFDADKHETTFPGCGAVPSLTTRALSFEQAHGLSELMQAHYKAGVEAGLAEAVRRVKERG